MAGSETPFFLFLTLILGGMFVSSVVGSAALREPIRLVPLTVLMLAHILLYWTASVFDTSRAKVLGYLALQGALAFAITLIGRGPALIFGLFLGLIGITAGLPFAVRSYRHSSLPVLASTPTRPFCSIWTYCLTPPASSTTADV